MGRMEEMVKKIEELKSNLDYIRNMGIAAHIDHGKTTLSDNLLYGAGMISKDTAGKQLALDFHEDEQERGITINAANVSMIHNYKGKDYLINLIDTPGHVDFGGDVTRAMRAVDGVVVVVCAVEGVMPQTKTVVGQALKENVRPVLFINKVDRLINELKLTPEELQKRFVKIITDVNKMIYQRRPEGTDWKVDVSDGSVAFGSAYNKWAINAPFMKETGITFKDIITMCMEERQKELAEKVPAHTVILDMVIRHLPNPLEAQKLRIGKIWRGDIESEIGKSMRACDPSGPVAMMITNITTFDKREGEVATGRMFSGTIKQGDEVYLLGAMTSERVQQVGIYFGASRQKTDSVSAGNIVGITGLKHAFTGETVTDIASKGVMERFEEIRHVSEPVVTKAVEPVNIKDLGKVIEILNQVAREDTTVKIKIDEESGEYLISGMGELHLEVIENRINKGPIKIKTSPPIVVYRETIRSEAGPVEGKSPNKHNKFLIKVEPLEEGVLKAINEGDVKEGRRKDRSKDIRAQMVDLGMNKDHAARIIDIYHGNVMVDTTKGIQHLNEVMELMLDSFESAMDNGPLSKEPVSGVKVVLVDTTLHEDAIHRGPAQVYPAVKRPIYACFLEAKPVILEPVMNVYIDTPQEYMGGVTSEMQRRRGVIVDMEQKEELIKITSKLPIAESFGFAGDIRSATEGHALWSSENAGFEQLPVELQNKIVAGIRDRKGMKKELPKSSEFVD